MAMTAQKCLSAFIGSANSQAAGNIAVLVAKFHKVDALKIFCCCGLAFRTANIQLKIHTAIIRPAGRDVFATREGLFR
jgi:hypothetical protein